MADQVTLPGGKKVNKWVAGGIAVGGAAAVFMVYRAHKSSATAATSSDTVTDPATGTTYPSGSTDPSTGETYGQEIGQYGSVSAADSAGLQQQQSALYGQGNLYGTGYNVGDYSTGTYGAGTTVSGSVYTSNSGWAQAATAGLTDIGYSATDVAGALGDYLTGTPVTSDQAAIINAALAEYGNPPSGSFQIITQPSGNTSSASTVAVPDVVGESLTEAQSTLSAVGLVYSGTRGVAGSTKAASQSPAPGTQVHHGTTVTVTAAKSATPAKAATYGIPVVKGESAAKATAHLEADGFKVDSGGLPGNEIVASTSPAGGTKAAHGTTVTLKGAGKTIPKTTST